MAKKRGFSPDDLGPAEIDLGAEDPDQDLASDAAYVQVRVLLKHSAPVGEQYLGANSLLAVVHLAPGVSLDYLVDAVRCGLAYGVERDSYAEDTTLGAT